MNLKNINIIKYNDPAHGWYKVPRHLLIDLCIMDKISVCSYQRGNYVYLEEDCDIMHLVKAIGKRFNVPEDQDLAVFRICFNITNKYSNKQSKIRSYEHFKNEVI